MGKNKFVLIFFCFLLGCVTKFNGVIKKKHTEYGLILPKEHWKSQNFPGADIFLVNENQIDNIMVNSQCEKISDSPISATTAQLLVGFSDIKYLSQNKIAILDREGMLSELYAKLDGVNRYIKIFVLRKNKCIYDIILISDEPKSASLKDFDELIKSFWIKVD